MKALHLDEKKPSETSETINRRDYKIIFYEKKKQASKEIQLMQDIQTLEENLDTVHVYSDLLQGKKLELETTRKEKVNHIRLDCNG